jgi:hypothetical protein
MTGIRRNVYIIAKGKKDGLAFGQAAIILFKHPPTEARFRWGRLKRLSSISIADHVRDLCHEHV